MRGLRLRAATGGCKIPGANMTAKERARQAGIRRNPPSQTGTRKHVPPYGNARTIRTQRVRTVVPCRDDSPLSTLSLKRSLAPLRGKTQIDLPNTRRAKAETPSGMRAAGTAAPYFGTPGGKRPGNGNALRRTSGPNAKKPFPRHGYVAGKASRRRFSTPLLSYVHLVEQIAAPPTLSIRKST